MLKVYRYPIIDSTQEEAKRLLQRGEETPFFVIAKRQTEGRGRKDSRWVSEEGGIYITYAFTPEYRCNPIIYNYGAAVVLKRFIDKLGIKSRIKWPNDIYVEDAKICGILSEAEYGIKMRIRLGIGLNVNNDIESVKASYPVTSLSRIKGERLDVESLADRLMSMLHSYLSITEPQNIIYDYSDSLDIIGNNIRIRIESRYIEGIAERIDDEGLLNLVTDNGLIRVLEGEIC